MKITFIALCCFSLACILFSGSRYAEGNEINKLASNSQKDIFDSRSKAFGEIWKSREDAFNKIWELRVENFKKSWEKEKIDILKIWNQATHSSNSKWVRYSNNYMTKSAVDFKNGTIEISIHKPLSATPNELKNVDNEIASEVNTLVKSKDPNGVEFLGDQLVTGEAGVVTPYKTDKLIVGKVEKKVVVIDGKGKLPPPKKFIEYSVKLHLVKNHLAVRVKKYIPLILEYSKKMGVSAKLITSIIHAESYFNPQAVSSAYAFGLMQLIPRYGAFDAYQYIYSEDVIVSKEYLFDPRNNVELGTAYLKLLQDRDFSSVSNKDIQEYYQICGYNWGPSNVKKLISRHRLSSLDKNIVFSLLEAKTPKETSAYLKKVTRLEEMYAEVF